MHAIVCAIGHSQLNRPAALAQSSSVSASASASARLRARARVRAGREIWVAAADQPNFSEVGCDSPPCLEHFAVGGKSITRATQMSDFTWCQWPPPSPCMCNSQAGALRRKFGRYTCRGSTQGLQARHSLPSPADRRRRRAGRRRRAHRSLILVIILYLYLEVRRFQRGFGADGGHVCA